MPKRARPGRLVRIARHEKHQEMRRGKKKQKRQNMAQFKEQLLGVKTPKNHALNSLQQAEEPTSNEQDFKQILKNRARARRERFDSWRKGENHVALFDYLVMQQIHMPFKQSWQSKLQDKLFILRSHVYLIG